MLTAFPPDAQEAASTKICKELSSDPHFQRAQTVAFFSALPGEPELAPLAETCRASGKEIAYPRLEGVQLVFHAITSAKHLGTGRFGLREPDSARCPVVPSTSLDLVLVPGLAFGPHGWRLGRGRGYYDRWLAQLSPGIRRLGVAFHCQVLETGPAEFHDEKLHGLCTERGLVWCGGLPESPVVS